MQEIRLLFKILVAIATTSVKSSSIFYVSEPRINKEGLTNFCKFRVNDEIYIVKMYLSRIFFNFQHNTSISKPPLLVHNIAWSQYTTLHGHSQGSNDTRHDKEEESMKHTLFIFKETTSSNVKSSS